MGSSYASARKVLEKTRKDLDKQAKALAASDPDLASMLGDDAAEHAHVIAKIDAGSYNVCDACKGTITDERLAALPAAVLCYECAGEKKPKAKAAKPTKASSSTKAAKATTTAKPTKAARPPKAAPAAADLLRVWVDIDLCSGSGRCAKAVPDLFAVGKGGACHLRSGKKLVGGAEKLVDVPPALEKKVVAAAEKCPDQCVFVEVA